MTDKLIVVADLGRVKAYRVTRDNMSTSSRLELVDNVGADGSAWQAARKSHG